MSCYKCGGEISTGTDNAGLCHKCSSEMGQPLKTSLSGWICPKCGAGNSPYNSTCGCWLRNSKPSC